MPGLNSRSGAFQAAVIPFVPFSPRRTTATSPKQPSITASASTPSGAASPLLPPLASHSSPLHSSDSGERCGELTPPLCSCRETQMIYVNHVYHRMGVGGTSGIGPVAGVWAMLAGCAGDGTSCGRWSACGGPGFGLSASTRSYRPDIRDSRISIRVAAVRWFGLLRGAFHDRRVADQSALRGQHAIESSPGETQVIYVNHVYHRMVRGLLRRYGLLVGSIARHRTSQSADGHAVRVTLCLDLTSLRSFP
jgi:hypothetical protein